MTAKVSEPGFLRPGSTFFDTFRLTTMGASHKLIIVKNAFANVARGGANALVTIALPPVLTRTMTTEAYGAWALVLQLSTYVGYFDFGLQTAVARFVAHCTERGDHDYRDRIVSTYTATLSATGLVAV